MNKKLLGLLFMLGGLALAGLTYYCIIVVRAGMIPTALCGSLAGACLGGAFQCFKTPKKK